MKLTEIQKRSVFKQLASKSQYATGLEFGFDKHYKSNTAVVNAVNKIYRQVRDNPEKFSVSPELMQMVEEGMTTRRTLGSAAKDTGLDTLKEKSLEKLDQKDLVLVGRKKAWVLLNKKLDKLGNSRREFNKESLMSIAKVAGIIFDKGQIVTGEATEHIALKAKIDKDMTVEEMMTQLISVKRANEDDGE